ncbi:MAG TPA: hypothetical protein VFL79_01615 [Terriglobia bacterium]|nr:hypothetical protein [Terriglobia bacterium]
MGQIRKRLSVLVLWSAFLLLYLGGAVMLVIGLVLASRAWWAVVHQHASIWVLGTKTAEALVLGVGFLLILIIPVFHHRTVGRSRTWRTSRSAETDRRVVKNKDDPLATP